MDPENSSEWGSPRQIHALALLAATALGLYLCYLMTLPFVPALTWALALAVVFMPVHRRLESAVKHPHLAASISVLGIGLVVVVPATFMAHRLVSEAAAGADTIRSRVESGEWQRVVDGYPGVAPFARWVERQVDLPGIITTIGAWLTNAIASISVVGAIILSGEKDASTLTRVLGFIAIVSATVNLVSGYMITDRMLKMFKKREPSGK